MGTKAAVLTPLDRQYMLLQGFPKSSITVIYIRIYKGNAGDIFK